MSFWPRKFVDCLSALNADPTDDFVDRLNYVYTVSLLLFFAALVGSKQHFGSPIQCMAPSHFPETWVTYSHDYCFITSTYSLNVSSSLASGISTMIMKEHISYYQWVPYVLVVQAFLLILPKIFWNSVASFQGLDIRSIVEETMRLNLKESISEHNKELSKLASFILQYLNYTSNRWLWLHLGGSFATFTYMLAKWLSVVIVVSELFLINYLIGDNNYLWGYNLMQQLLAGSSWKATGLFPRITFCDLHFMHLGQLNVYSMQCVLMLNTLNEKIFVLMWFMLSLLAIVNLSSALFITISFFTPPLRYYRILQMLQIDSNGWDIRNKHLLIRFVNGFLKADGALLLWFVDQRAGGMMACELAWHMWAKLNQMQLLVHTYGHVDECEDDDRNKGIRERNVCGDTGGVGLIRADENT